MKYIVPCPHCYTIQGTAYVDTRDINGKVSVMCWDRCGMDYDVNGIWFMIHRIDGEEE